MPWSIQTVRIKKEVTTDINVKYGLKAFRRIEDISFKLV